MAQRGGAQVVVAGLVVAGEHVVHVDRRGGVDALAATDAGPELGVGAFEQVAVVVGQAGVEVGGAVGGVGLGLVARGRAAQHVDRVQAALSRGGGRFGEVGVPAGFAVERDPAGGGLPAGAGRRLVGHRAEGAGGPRGGLFGGLGAERAGALVGGLGEGLEVHRGGLIDVTGDVVLPSGGDEGFEGVGVAEASDDHVTDPAGPVEGPVGD